MLANTRLHKQARRGIVLVLILAMLGLLALIGVTFATFSGQAKLRARIFSQSVVEPQDTELMDFALSQLISDTSDPRSALRGHSLARDMYGNDGYYNGYLTTHPTYGTPFYLTGITKFVSPVSGSPVPGVYVVSTNILSNDPNFYSYNFTGWIIRARYTGSLVSPTVVPSPLQGPDEVPSANLSGMTTTPVPTAAATAMQTFEVLIDGGANMGMGTPRALTIAMLDPPPFMTGPSISGQFTGHTSTNLINWGQLGSTPQLAQSATAAQLPGLYLAAAANNGTALGQTCPIVLDGRWLRAFNGSGMNGLAANAWGARNGAFANFRFNQMLNVPAPDLIGMDEDYDACDLENWFLAMQSADGQVMVPSFHRPGIIRYDPNNPNPALQVNDWQGANVDNGVGNPTNFYTSAARILRPRGFDGNDATTFPDLVPDKLTGKITYDVDNDGDGATDSVWLDLGYPPRRDPSGKLYKPLFAFMVIGLNGRIPLNTAGNLATGGNHAAHLGNSVSEIDPRYALQNAFQGRNDYNINVVPGNLSTYINNINGQPMDVDPFDLALNDTTPGATGVWNGPSTVLGGNPYPTYNTQVDNAINANPSNLGPPPAPTFGNYQGVDVRLTQLRNILAGTRPQPTPLRAPTASDLAANGDANVVFGSFAGGQGGGKPYYFPNTIADGADNLSGTTYPYSNSVGNYSLPLVQRTTPAVAGRWGEAASVPGPPIVSPTYGLPLNMVQVFYANPVRAGYSFDMADLTNVTNQYNGQIAFPQDAADDNFNAFDVYPPRTTGENGDADFFDALGALMLPVERMRRFVTPADINGTGSVVQYAAPGGGNGGRNIGPDNYGRVQFKSYFRPAGATAAINLAPNTTTAPYYGATGYGQWDDTGAFAAWGGPYFPDTTNNQFHGYEGHKVPNLFQNPGPQTGTPPGPIAPIGVAGMPIDMSLWSDGTNTYQLPGGFPTYNNTVNSQRRLDGVNEADEMNLYAPNAVFDSPYGPGDLEWLYRQQDVDGASLSSRLAQLAPISFTNSTDGLRRRRLFSLDSWDSTNFVWANDNPAGAFANNSRFLVSQSASFQNARIRFNGGSIVPSPGPYLYTPALAHRDRKINLNYPLPVSNDSNEPVRQKWISETYQLLKAVLPPLAVDTPEELAQLSQFVINIVDFRDPDATMTHWINPDVVLAPGTQETDASNNTYYTYPTLTLSINGGNLDQYGMEHNPVAINEVLAYSFTALSNPTSLTSPIQVNRFFIELVNTLTAGFNPGFAGDTTGATPGDYYGTPGTPGNFQSGALNLGGFNYTANDPYGGGCWDLVFTADDGDSRPDPYRGELVYQSNGYSSHTNFFGLVPLNRDSFTVQTPAPNDGDVTLLPVSPNPPGSGNNPATNPPVSLPATQPSGTPTNYFYVIGNPKPSAGSYEYQGGFSTQSPGSSNGSSLGPPVTQYLQAAFDPMPLAPGGNTPPTPNPSSMTWRLGILPGMTSQAAPSNFSWKIPSLMPTAYNSSNPGQARYYWVCLRRPANPFAPVSATNPMCVVDSMRFPYIDGTGSLWTNAGGSYHPSGTNSRANTIYSAQRPQPYRGGHAVPPPYKIAYNAGNQLAYTGPANVPPDPRYGYTEQICYPENTTSPAAATFGQVAAIANTYPSTNNITFQSLGLPNTAAENWDYFPFNDRDFTSVAELLLVPGCPPGLFTKQFAEFAPSQTNAANIFANVAPRITPNFATSNLNGVSQGHSVSPTAISTNYFDVTTAPFLSVSTQAANLINPTYEPLSSTYTPPTSITTVPSFNTSGGTGFILGSDTANPTHATYSQQPTKMPAPVQPHVFPYLVDRFFYTGASNFLYPPKNIAFDPATNGNPVVGGPAADGWFKMLAFFEVPSQMNGAVGPVAQGANFDWARQDTKPGLMNLNLIIDEEAFFSILGQQSTGNPGWTQTLLNGIQLPAWPSRPYALPLSQSVAPPILYGMAPMPLVVSGIQWNGAPSYVYPLVEQLNNNTEQGYLANDPIQLAINTANGLVYAPVGNRIKAAFAQFLWLRHGGSGYLFGFGNGLTGQNTTVQNISLTAVNAGPIPAERPFHELSYPDIDYTVMRPAALPPSTPPLMQAMPASPMLSNPTMTTVNATAPPTVPITVSNAQALVYTPSSPPPAPAYYFLNTDVGANPNYYGPYLSELSGNFPTGSPVVYTGDPGVRNPFLSQGYASSDITNLTPPYPVYPATTTYTVPAGVPLPVNLAFPNTSATPPVTMATVALPPTIPPVRLFQPPDAFGAGALSLFGYDGLTILPPPVSNATDSGDPWINNTVPNISTGPMSLYSYQAVNGGIGAYALNNGSASIFWPWMGLPNYNPASYFAGQEFGINEGMLGTPQYPPNTATGVLPIVTSAYFPAVQQSLALGSTLAYLGSNTNIPNTSPYVASMTNTDDRQHPYWRSEMLQKVMNLTTVRTHQYAVWITIGFFEIKREGDIGMLAVNPQLAFDVMGPELGASSGKNVRYRGFFIVDRLKLTGFNYQNPGGFRAAVTYRKIIQ